MKKIVILGSLLLFVLTAVMSQTKKPVTRQGLVNAVKINAPLNEGANSISLNKEGQGTLQFTKTGERFTNVIYIDSFNRSHVLLPVKPGTGGAPQAECKHTLPDACFATADKNIGLCICKSTDLSLGEEKYNFSVRCSSCNTNGSGVYKSN